MFSLGIRSGPGLVDEFLDGSPTLRCGNPLLFGYLSNGVPGMEFLDDSHGVHLPSGIVIAHLVCRKPSKLVRKFGLDDLHKWEYTLSMSILVLTLILIKEEQ